MPMRMADDNRSYNTFDAHRLLHWAGLQDPALQVALKKRLLAVYHDDNLDTSDTEVLARGGRRRPGRGAGARSAGIRPLCRCGQDRGSAMARSRHHVGAVGDPQRQYLVSGGQPTDVFEQALRQVAQEG